MGIEGPDKVCRDCKQSKPRSEYPFRLKRGYQCIESRCKLCFKKYAHERVTSEDHLKRCRERNKTTEGAAANKKKKAKYRASAKGKETEAAYVATDFYQTSLKERKAKYRKSSTYKVATKREFVRRKERYHSDVEYRLKVTLSTTIRKLVNGTRDESQTVMKYAGVDSAMLREHLEKQLSGAMTLDNYGSVWHLDHIIAKAYYDHEDEAEVKKCWNMANLRPMLGPENSSKGVKIDDNAIANVPKELYPEVFQGRIPPVGTRKLLYKTFTKGW